MNDLLRLAISASIEAGLEILNIYNAPFEIEYKADESPLTTADTAANKIIMKHLSQTDIPVLSEEGRSIPYQERKNWTKLWIVDPLDGTKEFIKKNDEFTVNIALIQEGKPILGVIYAPVLDELYYGEQNLGAFKVSEASKRFSNNKLNGNAQRLPLPSIKTDFGVVASRSHLSPETSAYIDEMKTTRSVQIITKGSSLKLCMIAEGVADVYPRFAPTSEWDIAAGHAIVNAAGGKIVQAANSEKELFYNKEDILNPNFIAFAK